MVIGLGQKRERELFCSLQNCIILKIINKQENYFLILARYLVRLVLVLYFESIFFFLSFFRIDNNLSPKINIYNKVAFVERFLTFHLNGKRPLNVVVIANFVSGTISQTFRSSVSGAY